MDPRLWTAIVAVNTYSLPAYTYDLSPWLGVLNNMTSEGHTITIELSGASGNDWVLANLLMLWRDMGGSVVSGDRPVMVTTPSMTQPVTSTCEGKHLSDAGTCVVQLGARSLVAGSLLKIGDMDYAAVVKYNMHDYKSTIAFDNNDGTASWRQLTKHEASWFMGHLLDLTLVGYKGELNLVDDLKYAPSRMLLDALDAYDFTQVNFSTITRAHTLFEWLNNGGISDGAIFEFSDNQTMMVPHTYNAFGSHHNVSPAPRSRRNAHQRHYQRLTMLDVYNTSKPACIVPSYPTHTVSLNSSVVDVEPSSSCFHWHASCAFCSPEATDDVVDEDSDMC